MEEGVTEEPTVEVDTVEVAAVEVDTPAEEKKEEVTEDIVQDASPSVEEVTPAVKCEDAGPEVIACQSPPEDFVIPDAEVKAEVEEPVTEEPVTEEPVTEEPVTEEPSNEPSTDVAVTEVTEEVNEMKAVEVEPIVESKTVAEDVLEESSTVEEVVTTAAAGNSRTQHSSS